jgi:hypothetical protein
MTGGDRIGLRAALRLAAEAHVIWVAGMILSAALIGIAAGDFSKATAAWAPLGFVLVAVFLTALLPINLAGCGAIWAARRSAAATGVAITVLAGIWAVFGTWWSAGEPFPSGTTIWLSLGGVVFGVALTVAHGRLSASDAAAGPPTTVDHGV